jgi:tellurite resistance protein TerC
VTLIPEVPTWLSLLVILATLVVTTVASLARSRREDREHVTAEAASPDPVARPQRVQFHPESAHAHQGAAGTVSATVPDGRSG